MKSIFLVWKDKNCNGENPEWIYMKANEFFEFKKQPENADRRFVQVGDKKSSLDDTVIFIEANEELYKKSNAEQSRKSRISKTKKEHPLTLISLDALRGSDEDIDNHERYSDSKGDEEYIMGKLQVGGLCTCDALVRINVRKLHRLVLADEFGVILHLRGEGVKLIA